jgi:hypothetical protein
MVDAFNEPQHLDANPKILKVLYMNKMIHTRWPNNRHIVYLTEAGTSETVSSFSHMF